MRKVGSNSRITLSKDALFRISAVLGIHKLLTKLFVEAREAATRLKGTHNGIVFARQSPLSLMLNGTQDDLLVVSRYLEVWPSGASAASAISISYSTVKPQDIAFL